MSNGSAWSECSATDGRQRPPVRGGVRARSGS